MTLKEALDDFRADFSQIDLIRRVQQLLIPDSPNFRSRRLNPRLAPVNPDCAA